jgi:hypothetical protein
VEDSQRREGERETERKHSQRIGQGSVVVVCRFIVLTCVYMYSKVNSKSRHTNSLKRLLGYKRYVGLKHGPICPRFLERRRHAGE